MNIPRPTRAPRIARVIERASGRMALIGLGVGGVVSSATGMSFVTQLRAEAVPIAVLAAVVATVTNKTFDEHAARDPEKMPMRAAMVSMMLLFSMEAFL